MSSLYDREGKTFSETSFSKESSVGSAREEEEEEQGRAGEEATSRASGYPSSSSSSSRDTTCGVSCSSSPSALGSRAVFEGNAPSSFSFILFAYRETSHREKGAGACEKKKKKREWWRKPARTRARSSCCFGQISVRRPPVRCPDTAGEVPQRWRPPACESSFPSSRLARERDERCRQQKLYQGHDFEGDAGADQKRHSSPLDLLLPCVCGVLARSLQQAAASRPRRKRTIRTGLGRGRATGEQGGFEVQRGEEGKRMTDPKAKKKTRGRSRRSSEGVEERRRRKLAS